MNYIKKRKCFEFEYTTLDEEYVKNETYKLYEEVKLIYKTRNIYNSNFCSNRSYFMLQ